ncbi:MAG: diadenylate cyclase CdaA [Saprospiraceae bacterium]|nr:diadenylate cyclase CdaA [Saprospiraceae bacterium]MCF8248255.1 diadenylate cyclase CdaA [Saprospiraceae bacterium]MCF8279991.1 diadenylate cyclase CdaA [Bacteroidales bacterium]MCF8309783.1 diadenylate cyclase CdaA [Saprospiraceae bacterium]MCF8438886.1 diadenylate cyclase CdaA [Saprospiraceae bacterium]
MNFLFEIGFLPVSLWDVLDVAIVGYLIYRVYLLLRGSIAFNIFIGIVVIYLLWWLVGMLKMDMLSMILSQFVNVGFIIIIIIFQQEVRRFLLMLGNTTLGRRSEVMLRWFTRNLDKKIVNEAANFEIKEALLRMSKEKTGALLVFSNNFELEGIGQSGVQLEAKISKSLLLSIFQKESPLHDGAVVISKGKIQAASCILPVSESADLPSRIGLRHRAALGISERSNAAAFIVSEETGNISFAANGKIEFKLKEKRLSELLLAQQM